MVFKRGDYVKVDFRNETTGESEWLWVRVERSDDATRIVFGTLDNEPVVMTDLHVGMKLAVSFDKIREHMNAASFNQ